MVQGTSSNAGKSTLVAAFCRLFAGAGYRVAPFKAQNMSNNAAVTDDGGEVGRAQAMQAAAAGVPVTVDMNPVLLKPQSDRTSQVVILGRARDVCDARAYHDRTTELWPVVTGALDRLRNAYDLVVVEGAGSPAEINLARYDMVNMRVARHADAPVLLVGDIDRGGVFASLYGTVALLPAKDRARVRGFIINKFRGDPSLLDSGFVMLEERTGIPTLGVLPHLDLTCLPAEDAFEWDRAHAKHSRTLITVAIPRLPHIANLDEFQPLMREPLVDVRWVSTAGELGTPDLIVIPGTKSTMADLAWLRERGLDRAIVGRASRGTPVLGICGGYQMLGVRITDEDAVESSGSVEGLGLLPVTTAFGSCKQTRRVVARVRGDSALWFERDVPDALNGYEIHMGRTTVIPGATVGPVPFVAEHGLDTTADGCCAADGLVVGTYVHGLLENASLRGALLARLATRKGLTVPSVQPAPTFDTAIDALANAVRDNLDCAAIGELVGLSIPGVRA